MKFYLSHPMTDNSLAKPTNLERVSFVFKMSKSFLLYQSVLYNLDKITCNICINIHKGALNSTLLRRRADGSYPMVRFGAAQQFNHIHAVS